MSQKYQAFLFDAYGTLFDVHSVVLGAGAAIAGDLGALSQVWPKSSSNSFGCAPSWIATRISNRSPNPLSAALWRSFNSTPASLRIRRLLNAYLAPAAFPDAILALNALRDYPRAILSNGTPAMLEAAVRSNGMESSFSHILSVDQVKTYKPSPRVYQLGPDTLHLPADRFSLFLRIGGMQRARRPSGIASAGAIDWAVPRRTWDLRPTWSCPAWTGFSTRFPAACSPFATIKLLHPLYPIVQI